MRIRRVMGWVASFVFVILVGMYGCGKSSSPTSPPANPGGGGGGSSAFDSGTLNAPATFAHTFATAGTFGYHCTFHQSLGMVGSVVVSAGAVDSTASVTGAGTSFTPPTVTIRPGGVVTWHITSGTHTVTSD
jgi:plastocyanin